MPDNMRNSSDCHIVRKGVALLAVTAVAFSLASCTPSEEKTLIKAARKEHGNCEVVSSATTDEGTQVVLRDELQGFEYTVSSFPFDPDGDGSFPSTTDSFEYELKVLGDIEENLDVILENYDATFDPSDMTFTLPDPDDAEHMGLEIATLFQSRNSVERLDGWILNFEDNDGEHIGSITLPYISWRTT